MSWIAYWMASARGNKRTLRHESAASRISYVAPVALGMLLLSTSTVATGMTRTPMADWRAIDVAGLAITALGLGFSVWARVHLGGNWSGNVTVKRGHELVRTGPYALVRHPIYTGLLCALLGTVVAHRGGPRALLGFALVVVGFVRKLRKEEGFMRETFGGVYAEYAREVAALVPGIF